MRFLAFLVFLLFIGFLFTARWYYVCEVKQLCEEVVEDQDVRFKSLKLTEGDKVILQGYDQFAFDSTQIAPRLNNNNIAFLDTLASILQKDSTRNMTITGFYRTSEKDEHAGYFENLGLARADAIRSLLVARGLDEKHITLDHGISEDEFLHEPLMFELYLPQDNPDDYDKTAFTFSNMTFSDANFAFDSDEFRPGEAFLYYADSVMTYFKAHAEDTLIIVGHTDNKGTEKYNLRLGERRANSAKEYFHEMGFSAIIKTDSKGETQPISTNKTDEGQQKNRRVNFVIKKEE